MAAEISKRDARYTRSMLITGIVLSLSAAGIFLTNREIDLSVAAAFYNSETGFVFDQYRSIKIIRKIIIFSYAFWYAGLLALMVFAIYEFRLTKLKTRQYGFLKLDLPQLIYLVTTSLAGPLLIANIILKNNWGRARPRQIIEFGGSQDFGPPLIPSDQCQTNCSFVSGEPASMFMIFFALSFMLPNHRNTMLGAAVVLGCLSGLMRMGQGGHFFSDVVFAGLFMAITAASLFWIMFLSRVRINK